MPELRRLLIGDEPQSWIDAGFTVVDGATTVGTIALQLLGPAADEADQDPKGGVLGWELTGIQDGSIDGIMSIGTDAPPAEPTLHANCVSRMDHVVIMTPDLERTTSAMRSVGFSPRRTREVPGSQPPRRQMFIWAGETILEVVGPTEATGSAPAAIWGLALTTTDMDRAARELGPYLSDPRPAVQPGRQIATVDTKALGISPALALMTPHLPTDGSHIDTVADDNRPPVDRQTDSRPAHDRPAPDPVSGD